MASAKRPRPGAVAAASLIAPTICLDGAPLFLSVADIGRGFALAPGIKEDSFGLAGMRDRVGTRARHIAGRGDSAEAA